MAAATLFSPRQEKISTMFEKEKENIESELDYGKSVVAFCALQEQNPTLGSD